jgi:hypothetical protein
MPRARPSAPAFPDGVQADPSIQDYHSERDGETRDTRADGNAFEIRRVEAGL